MNNTTRIILLAARATLLSTLWNPLQKSFSFEWSNMIDVHSQPNDINGVPYSECYIEWEFKSYGACAMECIHKIELI